MINRKLLVLFSLIITVSISPAQGQENPVLLLDLNIDHEPITTELSWTSEVGRSYQIYSSNSLAGPWSVIHEEPILADDTVLIYSDIPVGDTSQFFKVVAVDDLPPKIILTEPLTGSLGNDSQKDVVIVFGDDSGLDPSTVLIKVGDKESLNLSNDRVSLEGKTLKISPPDLTGQWGEEGSQINLYISVADMIGNKLSDHHIYFGTKIEPQFADEMVIINGSRIAAFTPASAGSSNFKVLQEEDESLTLRFTNNSTEIGPDKVLVIIDENDNVDYKRVKEVTNIDETNLEITITTESANLLDVLDKATITANIDDLTNFPQTEIQINELAGVGGLSGTVFSDGNLRTVIHVSLQIENREVEKYFVKVTPTLKASLTDKFIYEKQIINTEKKIELWDGPSKRFPIGGLPFPLWIKADFNIDASIKSNANIQGALEFGFSLQQSATFTIQHEDGEPSFNMDFADPQLTPIGPDWKFDGKIGLTGSVIPNVDILAYDLIGMNLSFSPFVEFNGEFEQALNPKMPSGETKYHWQVDAGIRSDVAMVIEGSQLKNLPAFKLFEVRKKLLEDCYPLNSEGRLTIKTSHGEPDEEGRVFFVESDEVVLETDGDCIGLLSDIQWYKNGKKIPGATEHNLILKSYKEGREGDYAYTVRNRLNISQVPILSHEIVSLTLSDLSLFVVAGPNETLKTLERGVSINNSDLIAYVGSPTGVISKESLYTLAARQSPAMLASNKRFSRYYQLNDDGVVAAQDSSFSGASAGSTIRKRSLNGSLINVARSGFSSGISIIDLPGLAFPIFTENPITISDYDIVTIPSINNNGQVVYAGRGGPGGNLFNALIFSEAVTGDDSEKIVLSQLPGASSAGPRPMIGDDGSVVTRIDKDENTSSIIFYKMLPTGTFSPQVVASIGENGDFNALGRWPGISDNGNGVIYYADSKDIEESDITDGVYAIIEAFGDDYQIAIHEHNTTGRSITIPFIDNERCNINLLWEGEDYVQYRTVFKGVSSGGVLGVYYTDILIDRPDPENPTEKNVLIDGPYLVKQIGETISGIEGTITDLFIHDSLNTNGRIALWLSLDSGLLAIGVSP